MSKKHWLLLPLGGVLMGLCLAFPQIGFLQWLAPVPALYFFFRAATDESFRLRRLYLVGFCYFFSFYLVVFHWFIDLYPMDFAGVSKGEAALLVFICWFGLSLLQTVFSALVLPLFGAICRTKFMRTRPLLLPFLFAAQYTVSEWSQTLTWMGVPWARLPLAQIDYGVIVGSAALFGSYFLTFAVMAVAGLLAFLLLDRKRMRFCLIAASAVFLVNLAAGIVGYATANPTKGEPVVVAAVQGNVGSDRKWTSGSRDKTFVIYEEYTKAAAEAGAEIVVFPETFVPDWVTPGFGLQKYLSDLAIEYDVTVICGAFHTDDEGLDYNAMFVIYPDGSIAETVYAKRHLVPFGEYVPLRPVVETLLPVLADIGMLQADLEPGKDSALIETSAGKVGGIICFDSIYEELTRDSVRDGANLLILPTNDSWFTDSRGIYMHHAQARLRAIESGRWIVRAADTGISALVSPNGKSFEDQPPLKEGMALGTVYAREGRTLYSVIGNLFVYLLIAAVLAVPAYSAVCLFYEKKNK